MNTMRDLWEDFCDVFLDITAMIAAAILGICFLVYEAVALIIRKIWRLFK